eukprot:CAMPEP_0201574200 /NCGR_PEP_ID=MMETSP0190_2-20130828/18533_1 /ASSEMBLY_ACC=CAM_ASM_000263 /TAXON_ID=37353 /ORGANISM="Rosalina sp." /LENGTH=275 /DNA_ID=CAMNT_0048002121 /DNA_START=472 /DNA_END=1299 /DNA_ORIENTATION=-
MARDNNVVILAGGFQDSLLMPVIPSMAAAMIELNTIRISLKIDVDGYGKQGVPYYGGGMKKEDHAGYIDNETFAMEYWQRAVTEAIADQMGYPLLDRVITLETGSSVTNGKKLDTIELYTRKECYQPQQGLNSIALGRVIGNDECAGINITVKGVARDNIQIFFSVILGIVPNKDDINDVEVRLEGVPNLEFNIPSIMGGGEIITAASLLHRVPMVLNELEPGFHQVSKLGLNRYFGKVEDWSNVNNDDVDNTEEAKEEEKPDTYDDKSKDKQDL